MSRFPSLSKVKPISPFTPVFSESEILTLQWCTKPCEYLMTFDEKMFFNQLSSYLNALNNGCLLFTHVRVGDIIRFNSNPSNQHAIHTWYKLDMKHFDFVITNKR